MSDFAIESDVPCPRRGGARTPAAKAAEKMTPGQSIFVDNERDLDIIRRRICRLGGRYKQRKMDGGWRIWRTS